MMQRQRLLENALLVMKNAHAPYSGYKIGCAVMGESGKIYVGCNIENVSYGATICAEQVAMGTAIAGSEKKVFGNGNSQFGREYALSLWNSQTVYQRVLQ